MATIKARKLASESLIERREKEPEEAERTKKNQGKGWRREEAEEERRSQETGIVIDLPWAK